MTHATFHEFASWLWRLRSIKSDLEMEKMKKAADITTEGYRRGFDLKSDGMTEKDSAAIMCSRWLEVGGDGIAFLTITSDWRAVRYAHVGPSNLAIRRGEVVKVEGGCVVDGYCPDIFRMACLGEPNDREERRLIECIIMAKNAAIATIRPRALCCAVLDAAAGGLREGANGRLLTDTTIGQSLGLGAHELRTLSRDIHLELQENTIFCVEPWSMD